MAAAHLDPDSLLAGFCLGGLAVGWLLWALEQRPRRWQRLPPPTWDEEEHGVRPPTVKVVTRSARGPWGPRPRS